MNLPDHRPVHVSEYPEVFRKRYTVLRHAMDPLCCCRQIGIEFNVPTELVRLRISVRSEVRICRDCWSEYYHARNDNYHVCPSCRRERNLLTRSRFADQPTYEERRRKSKFYTEEQCLHAAIRMLEQDYGMSHADAAAMVFEMKESLRIVPLKHPGMRGSRR